MTQKDSSPLILQSKILIVYDSNTNNKLRQ
jgi:hypothetical protein